ncbi:unnamed protein product [Acanthoscelides obtectus]|uniref:Uncharacterized protein n=1 Tax=Acanthoscelides obtectus TaxID=200917 RepID=A0A9P0K0N9_ACAOB|nr:unnamed protein product [Acanthoscelides obtectus]CAK1652992.1 hypothetical protein AOBTE_LOCUS18000 [Acanthoscelides obtectus]
MILQFRCQISNNQHCTVYISF